MAVVFGPRVILQKFKREVWFGKPLKRKHVLAELKTFVEKLESEGGLMSFKTDVRTLDELLEEYVLIVTRYVTAQVKKDNTLRRALFSATNEGTESSATGDAGQDLWIRDPFGEDEDLQEDFESLDEHSQKACIWLQEFTRGVLLYKCNLIFDAEIVAAIKKALADSRAGRTQLLWCTVTQMVRSQLPDASPKILLETLISMQRPNGMAVSEWANSFTLTRALVRQEADTTIGNHLAFQYFAGQFTPEEWAASKFSIPKTRTQMRRFSVPAFLKRVAKMNSKAFDPFRASMIHGWTKQLLAPQQATATTAPSDPTTNATATEATIAATTTETATALANALLTTMGGMGIVSPKSTPPRTTGMRRRPKLPCFAWRKGQCTRGDSCRFAHMGASDSPRMPETDSYDCGDCGHHHARGWKYHSEEGKAQIHARRKSRLATRSP